MARITAPAPGYSGTTAGVDFKNGQGSTDKPHVIEWLCAHGYHVEYTASEVAAAAAAMADAEKQNAAAAEAAAEREAAATAAKARNAAFVQNATKASIAAVTPAASKPAAPEKKKGGK